jgi:hypothetical protein
LPAVGRWDEFEKKEHEKLMENIAGRTRYIENVDKNWKR